MSNNKTFTSNVNQALQTKRFLVIKRSLCEADTGSTGPIPTEDFCVILMSHNKLRECGSKMLRLE